jgi:outer membrane receptor protein involved in Fe transport
MPRGIAQGANPLKIRGSVFKKFNQWKIMKKFTEKKYRNRKVYWAVISSVALSCGGTALAQTNSIPATDVTSGSSTNVTDLGNVTVVGQLDQARNQILPDLGASAYTIDKNQITAISQGGNAPMSQIILRAPGVVQDNEASGNLHVRGEHANLQYRINGVLLPEGISGFGLELSPHFIESMQLITGSLPAEYGFRTAGVVDITTKSGAFENGGDVEMYGGSYNTINPSFEAGGSQGNLNYFVDGSYDNNDLGIENPTSSPTAIHDNTYQYKSFSYFSYILDDTSRVNVMLSASYANFEIPNTPGLGVGTAPGGDPWNATQGPATFNSSALNEQQLEQNYYGVVTYQKTAGNLNYQASVFGRNSSVDFTPDPTGDLYFNGVASDVDKSIYSGGLQADASSEINDKHTLRAGLITLLENESQDTTTTVFNLDPAGNPVGNAYPINANNSNYGVFGGLYLQDEWKITDQITANYGGRFDFFNSSFDHENQLSPRANLIYKPTDWTTLHAGYSRYFTPPPVENTSAATVNQFDGTSNASSITNGISATRCERADYFDVGISQKINKHLQVGVDGYYKYAKEQLDDGLFGQTLILQPFNYARGRIYGLEFTGSYTDGGFSTYANFAYSVAQGENWSSSQYLFDPADLAYVKNNWIYLDHDQELTGSFGTSYLFKESDRTSTLVYLDALYGSGLRTDETTVSGDTIPNGGTVSPYYSINCGVEQSFKLHGSQMLKARFDIVNLTDNSYELRDGSGVGVNAASYGARIGFFGSLTYVF